MRRANTTLMFLSLLTIASPGCRAVPPSLAKMVVSDAVASADVKHRQDKLMGQPPAAADEMLGKRIETLIDTRRPGRELLLYRVKTDIKGSQRYAVEVTDGRITAVTKGKRNIDGAEDIIRQAGLKKKLVGQSPARCEADGELGIAVAIFKSRDQGNLVRVYDVSNLTNLRGARYCVLRFDAGDRCEKVRLVGVSASTKKDPLR